MKVVVVWLVFMVAMASVIEHGAGQACSNTFFSSLVQMIPCRSALVPFRPVPPSEACCTAVRTLGQGCMCVLVNGPPISGVDRNMAVQLPEKCAANFEPCDIEK